MRSHSGIQPYQCPVDFCDRLMTQTCNTVTHVKMVHHINIPELSQKLRIAANKLSFLQAGGPKASMEWFEEIWAARNDYSKLIKLYREKTGNFAERDNSEKEKDAAVEEAEMRGQLIQRAKKCEWDLTDRFAQYLLA